MLSEKLTRQQSFTGKDSQVSSSGFSTFSKTPSTEYSVALSYIQR
jgi:hypothetical protein